MDCKWRTKPTKCCVKQATAIKNHGKWTEKIAIWERWVVHALSNEDGAGQFMTDSPPTAYGMVPKCHPCHCPSHCVLKWNCCKNYLTLPVLLRMSLVICIFYCYILFYCILLYTGCSSVNWLAVSCILTATLWDRVLSASHAHNLCAWLLIILSQLPSSIIVTYR